MGDEGESFVAGLHRFVNEDTPLIGVVACLPYFSPARQAMSLSELRAGVWRQYEEVADFIGGLSDEQLARKGRVPLLKETPIGEQPVGMGGRDHKHHLTDHVGQCARSNPASRKRGRPYPSSIRDRQQGQSRRSSTASYRLVIEAAAMNRWSSGGDRGSGGSSSRAAAPRSTSRWTTFRRTSTRRSAWAGR
jgi:hypothetical protein